MRVQECTAHVRCKRGARCWWRTQHFKVLCRRRRLPGSLCTAPSFARRLAPGGPPYTCRCYVRLCCLTFAQLFRHMSMAATLLPNACRHVPVCASVAAVSHEGRHCKKLLFNDAPMSAYISPPNTARVCVCIRFACTSRVWRATNEQKQTGRERPLSQRERASVSNTPKHCIHT